MKYEQTEDEAQRPEGLELENEIQFSSKAKFKYTPWGGYEYEGEELDKSQIVSDNFHRIPSNCCRECEKERKPYNERYYKKSFENYGQWVSVLYCYENGYCQECAKKLTKEVYVSDRLPRAVKSYEVIKDDQNCLVTEYADGSVIEEMSNVEKAKEPNRD